MIHYNIKVDSEIVGFNLSKGELNQWLIAFYKELYNTDKEIFLERFKCNNDTLEEYLYENTFEYPNEIILQNEVLTIEVIKY